MPWGRQRSCGLPAPSLAWTFLKKASAQGKAGADVPSAARFSRYLPVAACQSPERSGLPSGVFGAGAEKFGLPSAVRGIPAGRAFGHCADKGTQAARRMINLKDFIFASRLKASIQHEIPIGSADERGPS